MKTIARLVDRMLVLFPFEVDFYREHGVDVVHVGHPLVDEVPVLPQAWDREGSRPARTGWPCCPARGRARSRPCCPRCWRRSRRLAAELPVEVRLIRAPTIPPELLDEAIELSGLPVEIVAEDRFAAIADSHLALCASGTATLEVGLLGTPMVMVYRLASWTYVAGAAAGPSAQRQPGQPGPRQTGGARADPGAGQPASGSRPRRRACSTDAASADRMREALAEVRGRLGEGGASGRAAARGGATMPARECGGGARN